MLNRSLIFLLVFLFLFGCNQKNQDQGKFENFQYKVSFVDSIVTRDGLTPNFYWQDSTGKLVSFDGIHKKVTLINFWATWCTPCKKEIPDLIEINKEFADAGVTVIGISTDKGVRVLDEVREFVDENNINYPIIIDNGKLSEAFGNIRGIPVTFLIDEDKNIVKKFLGIKSKDFFVEQIKEIMK